jgi:hypothetical protein
MVSKLTGAAVPALLKIGSSADPRFSESAQLFAPRLRDVIGCVIRAQTALNHNGTSIAMWAHRRAMMS